MRPINQAQISFDSRSVNEGFGRAAVAAFLSQLDPTVADLTDMKTAVSEAVTNAIVHGYKDKRGTVYITVKLFENGKAVVKVRDKGCGIPDIEKSYGAPVHHWRRGAGGPGICGDAELLRQRAGHQRRGPGHQRHPDQIL